MFRIFAHDDRGLARGAKIHANWDVRFRHTTTDLATIRLCLPPANLAPQTIPLPMLFVDTKA